MARQYFNTCTSHTSSRVMSPQCLSVWREKEQVNFRGNFVVWELEEIPRLQEQISQFLLIGWLQLNAEVYTLTHHSFSSYRIRIGRTVRVRGELMSMRLCDKLTGSLLRNTGNQSKTVEEFLFCTSRQYLALSQSSCLFNLLSLCTSQYRLISSLDEALDEGLD